MAENKSDGLSSKNEYTKELTTSTRPKPILRSKNYQHPDPKSDVSRQKSSESLKQFKARCRRKMMDSPQTDFVKDEYEKSASCGFLKKSETAILYDDDMALHECPWDPNYPEKPDRYKVILNRFKELGLLERCKRLPYTLATKNVITKSHTPQLYNKLKQICGKSDIDDVETDASNYDAIYFNEHTFKTAIISSGCAISLIEAVCKGVVSNGMAIIRPPGHHAMMSEFCGYCYFNNVAVAATYALNNNLTRKILVVDFDVHHGQGTQQLFYEDNRVLYFSIHRYQHGAFWPNLRESNYDYVGKGNGTGFNINFPLNAIELEDKDYLAIVHHILLPVAYEYQPDLIIFSAGYDACIGCPEGQMKITPGFYGHLITLLSGLATGKIAVCLEGGYFLPSLAEGAAMTMKSLLGDPPATLKSIGLPHDVIIDTINNLKIALRPYWNCFKVYPVYTDQNDPNFHKASLRYLGTPDKAPFSTRNCYPVPSSKEVATNTRIINDLQIEYLKLGTNQKVSTCYNEDMLLHYSERHIETSDRLLATYSLFNEWNLHNRCINLKPKEVDRIIVEKVHNLKYVDDIYNEKFEKVVSKKNTDMYYNEHTLKSLKKAVNCLVSVVDSVMKGETMSGAALIRPPGHHAGFNRASGFCYFNNIAIAAQYLLDEYSVQRVLIIDFDIHHGDGTQNLFYENNKVLYISIHRYDNATFFPKTKESNANYCGKALGEGFNVNIPINKETLSNIDYLTIFHRLVLPISYSFNPQVVLVSAGFDAGINDILGNYLISPDCFGHFIQLLKPLANGKLILSLEGGYNAATVKYSMNICIKTLLGDPLPLLDLSPNKVVDSLSNTIDNIIGIQKKYWPVLNVDKKISEALPKDELDALNKQFKNLDINNQDSAKVQI